MQPVHKGVVGLDGKEQQTLSLPDFPFSLVKQRGGVVLVSGVGVGDVGVVQPGQGGKLKHVPPQGTGEILLLFFWVRSASATYSSKVSVKGTLTTLNSSVSGLR